VIFCGNKENDIDKDIETNSVLLDSLFSLTSDDLYASTPIPSSLADFLFISEVLKERAPEVNWLWFLREELRKTEGERENDFL